MQTDLKAFEAKAYFNHLKREIQNLEVSLESIRIVVSAFERRFFKQQEKANAQDSNGVGG